MAEKDFRNKSRSFSFFALRPSFFMIDGDLVRLLSASKKKERERKSIKLDLRKLHSKLGLLL